MNKLLIAVAALAVAGSFAAAQAAQSSGQKKTAICHKTNSKKKPYRRIVVAKAAALKAHLKHPDDIVPAGKTCPQTLLTPTTGGVGFEVNLLGVAEQPDPADASGTGSATIRLRRGQGRVCFVFAGVSGITLPGAAAHIHRAAFDASGPVVVPLTPPDASGASRGCVTTDRTLVGQILGTPEQFYVNVHTAAFPAGAIRGQLALPQNVTMLVASMTGAAEKPSSADPDGSGKAGFLVDTTTGRICFTLAASAIQLPATASHIHKAPADQAGPVVVPLSPPDAGGTARGCVTGPAATAQDIAQNPGQYYANVHTKDYPAGAIRGQLSTAA